MVAPFYNFVEKSKLSVLKAILYSVKSTLPVTETVYLIFNFVTGYVPVSWATPIQSESSTI